MRETTPPYFNEKVAPSCTQSTGSVPMSLFSQMVYLHRSLPSLPEPGVHYSRSRCHRLHPLLQICGQAVGGRADCDSAACAHQGQRQDPGSSLIPPSHHQGHMPLWEQSCGINPVEASTLQQDILAHASMTIPETVKLASKFAFYERQEQRKRNGGEKGRTANSTDTTAFYGSPR